MIAVDTISSQNSGTYSSSIEYLCTFLLSWQPIAKNIVTMWTNVVRNVLHPVVKADFGLFELRLTARNQLYESLVLFHYGCS